MKEDKMTMTYEEVIKKMSNTIAKESGRDQEVIAYGLRLFLGTVIGYALLISVSLVLDVFKYSIIAALTTSIFRVFSGGAHASSQFRCCISGVFIFIPIGFIAKIYGLTLNYSSLLYITIFIFIYALFTIHKYVPADTPGKPISSQMQKKRLKVISFILLLFWSLAVIYFIQYEGNKALLLSSILGLFWQLNTLTPLGYKIIDKFDYIFKKIGHNVKEVSSR